MPPSQSKVQFYKPEELDFEKLAQRAQDILSVKPFTWQLEVAAAVLQGDDVIVDVGTGSGKTLCFTLPLLVDETDVVLTISPLTALMLDQAEKSAIPTIAICKETLVKVGMQQSFLDILAGKYRHIIVSPEESISVPFRDAVLSKPAFYTRLRAVGIDEAHCISLWGGSFRPDYARLGVLRGRFPKNVPFVIASATLPDHILDDIRVKLQLSRDATMVRLTNARPNVALSTRVMRFPEESKADLRFLIPCGASKPEDIDITLVYCNQRTVAEDAADRLRSWLPDGIPKSCVAFYHAKIGDVQKRLLEEGLQKGEIRILICTDAVGMGCDMRNIKRVILWGLPPSFCALVQRAGRAGRDFCMLGEAILIVPQSVVTKGVSEAEVEVAMKEVESAAEAENHNGEEREVADGVELTSGREEVLVNEGGIRVGHESEDEADENPGPSKQKRRKKNSSEFNSIEARFLHRFASTTDCLRKVWDEFFNNKQKHEPFTTDQSLNTISNMHEFAGQLTYPQNTTYQLLPGTRCCDRCEPRLFPLENIVFEKVPGLKAGRKKKLAKALENAIRAGLVRWREELLEIKYPNTTLLSAEVLMGDEIIDQIAGCGERIDTKEKLQRRTRWYLAHQKFQVAHTFTSHGTELLELLKTIYSAYDREVANQDHQTADIQEPVPTTTFYGESTREQATQSNTPAQRGGRRARRARGRPGGRRGH